MAVTTKKQFPNAVGTNGQSATVFTPVGIQLNNQDDLDVYVTLSGGTRVLQLRQATGSTAQSNHPQVNNTDGLYFPAVSAGTTLYNYQLSTDNNTITFSTALPTGATVFVERRTRDADSSYTTFASGSTIRATDLNNSSTESNFTAQDGRNKALTIEGVLFRGDQPSTNFVTSDHIVAGTIVTSDLANDSVTADKIPNDTINSEHYAAGSIDTEHIANENITTAKLAPDAVTSAKLADNAVNSEHYVDGSIDLVHMSADSVDSFQIVDGAVDHVHLAADIIDGDNIQDDVVNSEHIAAGALDNEHYAAGSITSDKLNGATVVTNSEQAASTPNDTSFFTTAAAEARYFNASTGETIKDGQTFPDNDTTIATTAAINDRIIDLVDDVGGFVPIANETSFPTSNPDVNDGAGTIVSVSAASTNLVPSGTTVTIANGRGSGLAVIITGVSATIPSGFGFLVETTTTDHTYAFHRLVPKATEVTTVAGKATEIGLLGTTAVVQDLAILGTADVVADLAILGTNDVVADLNTLGTADVVADLNTLGTADVVNDMNILGTSANVTAMDNCSGSIASINNASSNLNSINNFGDTYQVSANNPSTDGGGNALAAGDLYFNTSANELKVYNGSAWQGGVTATGNFAVTTGNTFTGNNIFTAHTTHNDNVKALFGTGSDLEIYHNGTNSHLKATNGAFVVNANQLYLQSLTENYLAATANGSVELYYDNSKRFETGSYGTDTIGQATAVIHNLYTGGTKRAGFRADNANTFTITDAQGHNFFLGQKDAQVELYHDNTLRFNTHAYGSKITAAGAEPHGQNAISRAALNISGQFGGGLVLDDLGNGGVTHYLSGAGAVYNISTTTSGNNPEKAIEINRNNNVELYYDNSKKLETTSTGVSLTGSYSASYHFLPITTNNSDLGSYGLRMRHVYLADDGKFRAGNTDDLQIYHNGLGSFITNTTGDLDITNTGDDINITAIDDIRLKPQNGEQGVTVIGNGAVELYYDNSKKLETTSTGVEIPISVNGQGMQLSSSTSTYGQIDFDANRGASNQHLGRIRGLWNGTEVGMISIQSGTDTTNKDDGYIGFRTRVSGGSLTEKFRITSEGNVRLVTDTELQIGASQDIQIYHDGSNSRLENNTGSFIVKNKAQDGDVQIQGNDGGSNINLLSFDTSEAGNAEFSGDIKLTDGKKAKFGFSNDLSLGHVFINNSHNGVINNATNVLFIESDNTTFRDKSGQGAETLSSFVKNGAASLYYDNVKKFETTSAGVTITGDASIGSIVQGDFRFKEAGSGTTRVHWRSDEGDLLFTDDYKASFGSSADLKIRHNGTNSYIDNNTGSLLLRTNVDSDVGGDIFLKPHDNEDGLIVVHDAGVQLYYDNVQKFRTSSIGTTTTGNAVFNGVTGGNSMQINLPDGNSDSVLINGGSSQGRTTLRIQAGNATSGSSTGMRWAHSSTTDVGQIFIDNASSHFNIMNTVQGNDIRFHTSSSENSSGSVHVASITNRGAIQGSGDSYTRPAYSFTNDTDSGMYRRSSNVIGFATAANARYFMSGGAFAPNQDNADDLGGSSNRWDDVRATNGNIQTSDRNEKNTITATDLGLDFINKLSPVSYKWNESNKNESKVGKRTHYGLIAQDVETILKGIGKTSLDFAGFCYDKPTEDVDGNTIENPREYYGLRYNEFMAPMIKAIQELSTEINTLKTKVAALEAA